ncbi:MAG: SPASM domain-containing protein [Candidatus Loosdrechtia sp.]|uniref:SPASM domain-containing protein n=1 Tax=Candidatus Loosdrechtia sp. TaxID=3101272 RepID=UPI00403A87D1
MENSKIINDIHRLVREKNRTLNQWEQYYRKDSLESFPQCIQFPTGTRCNIKCRFCTGRDGENTKSYKDLSLVEFRLIVDNKGWEGAFKRCETVALYGWGEPLFNQDYEKIFDYIADNFSGLGISICTNGILFNQKWSEKIIAINNSEVNFSVNAATKETFRKITGSNQFERVITNIRELTDLRERHKTKNPHISLSYVATTENIRELPQFVNLSANLKADSVLVQDIMMLTEDTKRLSLTNEPELACEIFRLAEEQAKKRRISFLSYVTHQVDYFSKSPELTIDQNISSQFNTIGNNTVPSPYFTSTDCFDPWERMMIGADGEVFPCCRSGYFQGTSFGNIYKQSFLDIWNGETYRYIRKTINTSNPPQSCAICPKKAGLS